MDMDHGTKINFLKIIKDEFLKYLLNCKEYPLILFSKFPVHVKKKILESNELKEKFKNIIINNPKFISTLVGNDSFLIYQLAFLYYTLFKEIPKNLLEYLDPKNLLFDFMEIEKELCNEYLSEFFVPSIDYESYIEKVETFDDIKLIIPFLTSTSNPLRYFKFATYVYYNIWKNIGKEFLIKLLKILSTDSLNIIFDYIVKDEEMLEHLNPFFVLGYLYKIGYYCNISVVPLFIGDKKYVLKLLTKLRDKIKTQEPESNSKKEALYIVRACAYALINYPVYYKERENGLGSYESLYYKTLKEILPDKWIDFTIYKIIPEFSQKYPPIMEEEILKYANESQYVIMFGVGCYYNKNNKKELLKEKL